MLRGVALLVLFASVLAGCLAEPPRLPDLPETTPPWSRIRCGDELVSLAAPRVGCNVRVSRGPPANEVHIALNPANPQNLIAGAKDYTLGENAPCDVFNVWAGTYRSEDGGRTWTADLMPGHPGDSRESALAGWRCSSDPVVIFDKHGHAYYSGLAIGFPGPIDVPLPPGLDFDPLGTASGIYVAKSTDGGATYSQVAFVAESPSEGLFHDKQWLAYDPEADILYVAWTAFTPEGSSLNLFSRSTDGGATWSAPLTLFQTTSPSLGDWATIPAVGPFGEVYVTWIDFASGFLYFTISTTNGQTFSDPVPIGTVVPPPERRTGELYRTLTIPTMAVARTGPAAGTIAIAWNDNRTGNNDIVFHRSEDGGRTWLGETRLNDDNGTAHQYMPMLDVSPDGTFHAIWYDARGSSSDRYLNVYYAWSADGVTWSKNARLTDFAFDASLGRHQSGSVFIGDYIGLAAGEEAVHALWADTRSGRSEVFTAMVEK